MSLLLALDLLASEIEVDVISDQVEWLIDVCLHRFDSKYNIMEVANTRLSLATITQNPVYYIYLILFYKLYS